MRSLTEAIKGLEAAAASPDVVALDSGFADKVHRAAPTRETLDALRNAVSSQAISPLEFRKRYGDLIAQLLAISQAAIAEADHSGVRNLEIGRAHV